MEHLRLECMVKLSFDDAGCQMQDTGCKMCVTGHLILMKSSELKSSGQQLATSNSVNNKL